MSLAEDDFKTVGNIVTFGTYPQTAEGTDETPIEWIVLDYDSENNKALLISRFALGCREYNSDDTDVTWETSVLRAWLNGTFLNEAFTEEEQKAIATAAVDNRNTQGNNSWSTSGGNNTEDKAFLLSYSEAKKYFSPRSARACEATAWAKAQGAYTQNGSTVWWL